MSNSGVINSAPCMWMRAGTSKGAYFLAEDLPQDILQRDAFLLAIMGSPDARQIDGIGGADPLTSKVAIISKSKHLDADVDYLFLQVFVDQAIVTDAQNCGNILAGVGAFSIERGLVEAQENKTKVAIYMVNTEQLAEQLIETPNAKVNYTGNANIDGVPGYASPVPITFKDTAGATCGALLPTGNQLDIIDNIQVTCIDNGMPVVLLKASDFALTGQESRLELEQNTQLRNRLENIRLIAGPMMNLGDVTEKTVPKMTLISPPQHGGSISTRTFIPHRCHASIGVLGAVSVATACTLPLSPAYQLAKLANGQKKQVSIEHPIGELSVILDLDKEGVCESSAILRTCRKLFDGEVFA